MIKDVLRIMNEYGLAYSQVNDTYLQAKDYIDKNYVKDSQVYNSTLESAQKVKNQALEPLRQKAMDDIKTHLNGAKERLQKAVSKPIPASVTAMIPLVPKMTEAEQKMLLDTYKGNYLATKMLYQAIGIKSHSPVEDIINELDDVVDKTTRIHFASITPSNSYMSRLLLQGDYIDGLDKKITDFLNQYDQEAVDIK